MRRTRTAHLCAALALSATAVFGLTACTGSPAAPPAASGGASAPAGTGDQAGDGGQSTADACALVQQTISDATESFQSASPDDTGAVADSMTAAAEKLGSISSQVTNDQVSALVPQLQEVFTQASGVMRAVTDGDMSRAGELADLAPRLQESYQGFADICADNG